MIIPDSAKRWVAQIADQTTPDQVVWCDGSAEEHARLTAEAVKTGVLIPLNQEKLPGCYLHRSHPNDVARSEHLTFICTRSKEAAGPTNNWMDPADARKTVGGLFKKCMKGRTLYVVPFLMGPPSSPFSKVGIEITDSIYVVLNMRIMTRMGAVALDHLQGRDNFTRCLHSLGELDPEKRFILHFPEDNEIWSIGSGYGGNALLGKKCLALRIASWLGKQEGWLAEHMLILGVQTPDGNTRYITGAFPSACGKTNLAMLVPPPEMAAAGYKVWTLGDDIAWLRPGEDGRLWAINPEAGFFGVVPGTSAKTNPNAMRTIARNTIYTNVALRKDGTVWWEGHDEPAPDEAMDWQGMPWTPFSSEPAAHPNSRFTAPAVQCPSISPLWEDPRGVPIDAMLFGARRQRVVPLVFQGTTWQHGVFLAATLASETTAAAAGKVGVLRRDPMAMLPFCGYNMADYWGHWLEVGAHLAHAPKIFRVNWFRTGANGKFLWPGFGDNLRVLQWIIDRCAGKGEAERTFLGYIPTRRVIDRTGIDVPDAVMDQLLHVDRVDWLDAIESQQLFFEKFGAHLPGAIVEEHQALAHRVSEALLKAD
ncbi:phosphoenolpyruvate carboxykinase (GTP) [Candidatus Binatia bacterium]|nr:phosphoenolpyruvate carboxykinase (GTP) [Candidatus Binatia bacterium]